jgi:hypothetical protein
MKYLITIFSISIFLISNAQNLKVYHHKSGRVQRINNEDKVLVKLKNGETLFGRINIDNDAMETKINVDNVNISKNNIEYIQYSPMSKILKVLGIGLEIINVTLIAGGVHIWNLLDPGGGFVSIMGYIISIALVGGGVALVPVGISLLKPIKVYGKKYLIDKIEKS